MDGRSRRRPAPAAQLHPAGRRAATLHLARSVCRRAERVAVSLAAREEVDKGILRYLNRLSDLLFVLARVENHAAGAADQTWEK